MMYNPHSTENVLFHTAICLSIIPTTEETTCVFLTITAKFSHPKGLTSHHNVDFGSILAQIRKRPDTF